MSRNPEAIRKAVMMSMAVTAASGLRSIDLRAVILRAADALNDAGTVGGAPQTYLMVERELRTLIAVMDEVAARDTAPVEEGQP